MWFPRSEPLCLFQMYLKMFSCWGKSNSKHQNNPFPAWWSGTCGLIDNILQPARDSDGSFLEILWPLTSFCDGKRRFYTTWIMGLNKKHTNLVITNFNAPCWKVQPCEQLKHLHMPDHQMKGSDPKMRKQDCIFSGHSDTFVLNNLFRITQRESIYVPSN